jgi:ribosomal protein S18 acetylase RimI-like enzyme
MSDAIGVRWAAADDVAFAGQDGYVPAAAVARKIAAGEVAVAERAGERVGYVRLEYLWGTLPYIALIRVVPEHRRHGVGRSLLAFLERELRARGHTTLLSSSQADEPEPQAWHRRQGFVECGILAGVNAGGVGELFFRKPLRDVAPSRA